MKPVRRLSDWLFLSTENYSLEFTLFNSELITAILGINPPYLQADPNDKLVGMGY